MAPASPPGDDVEFSVVDPRSDEAVAAMTRYFAELDDRFPEGFDPGDTLAADAGRLEAPDGVFVVARSGGRVVGCGGLQTLDGGFGEIKRMWVDRSTRGVGVGRRLLQTLEEHARRLGHVGVRLDTNGNLPEAVSLYRSSGYVEIDRYNDNPYPDHFFEKRF